MTLEKKHWGEWNFMLRALQEIFGLSGSDARRILLSPDNKVFLVKMEVNWNSKTGRISINGRKN